MMVPKAGIVAILTELQQKYIIFNWALKNKMGLKKKKNRAKLKD